MKNRLLGKSGISIYPIGFGGIPIQKVTQEEANKIIKEAINNNVNFFDSARGYTCSEQYLGNAFVDNSVNRNQIFLATKSMSRTYEKMKEDIDISLKNFKTDYIDLYQCHNVSKKEDFEILISDNGAYKALKEAKAEGKIKHIGITSHSYDFLMYLLDSEYNGLFQTIQFPYNFIEVDAEKLFAKANKLGIGTIAMKPLAGGMIDKAEVAIKYLLNDDNLSVLIPGMGSIEEVKQNTSISSIELNSEDKEYIENVRKEMKGSFCHRCGYCLPCAKGIDIPSIFTLEKYFMKYGLKDWAISRYNAMKAKIDDCIQCGKCVRKCPYEIDIPNKLKTIGKMFEVYNERKCEINIKNTRQDK